MGWTYSFVADAIGGVSETGNSNPQETVRQTLRELTEELYPDDTPEVTSMHVDLEEDLGIGSMERVRLLQRLEAALDRRLDDQAVYQAATPNDLVDALALEGEDKDVATVEIQGEAPPAPDSPATLLDLLEHQVEGQPDRPYLALVGDNDEPETVTFAQLRQGAARTAAGLSEAGVEPGDRVALMLPTGREYFDVFFGALWLGAIPVPLYPPLRPDQAEDFVHRQRHILANSQSRVLVTFEEARLLTEAVRAQVEGLETVRRADSLIGARPMARRPAEADEVALLQYTSGSTGDPKGVTLTHRALLSNVAAFAEGFAIEREDVVVSWLPLYHDMGLIGKAFGCLYYGMPLVLMGPEQFLARPSRWLHHISRYRAQLSAAPNFGFAICSKKIPDEELEGLDLSSWRVALNGSEPVLPETIREFCSRFGDYGFRSEAMFPAYGLAENSVAVTFPPVGREPVFDSVSRSALEQEGLAEVAGDEPALEFVSCGSPVEGTEVRLVDDQNQKLDERRQGRVQFRGRSAMREFYNDPEKTSEVRDDEGWIDTGDLGYLVGSELFLTGRRQDLIVVGGRNLHPEDIESTVGAVEGVRKGCVAALGVKEDEGGTQHLVVIAESRQSDRSELKRAIQKVLSEEVGQRAQRVLVVPPRTLPKTPSGKLRRGETLKRYEQNSLTDRPGRIKQALMLAASSWRGWLGYAWTKSRRWLAGARAWAALVAAVAPVLLVCDVSPSRGGRLAVKASRLFLKLAGMPLTVEGKPLPKSRATVVVSNHESLLDALVLTAACEHPLRFATAEWVADHAILGILVRGLGHVRVERDDPTQADENLKQMRRVLEEGDHLGAFPEGRLLRRPGLRRFRSGVFQVAAETEALIQPVVILGSGEVLPPETLMASPAPLRVHFLEARPAPEPDRVQEVMKEIRQEMLQALE